MLGKVMHAAVDVGVAGFIVAAHSLDDHGRLLRGGRVVEINQRLPANGHLQNRKVAANTLYVENVSGAASQLYLGPSRSACDVGFLVYRYAAPAATLKKR